MHVLAAIVAIVGFIAVWWWRVQQAKGAADAAIDLAGKAKGAFSRAHFRRRAGNAVLAGVDSPGMAAATILYSLSALKRPVSLSDEQRIDGLLERVCGMAQRERDDAMAFAAWAAVQVADTNEIIRRLHPLWMQLEEAQRRELVDMAFAVAETGGPPNDAQASSIKRLSATLFPR